MCRSKVGLRAVQSQAMMLLTSVVVLAIALVLGCGEPQSQVPPQTTPMTKDQRAVDTGASGELIVFIAASLNRCFEGLIDEFEASNKAVDVVRESGASRLQCRKVTQLHREADIIATADYDLIREMLAPDYADWAIAFARNRMVIAYTDKSKYAREIDGDNWYEILLRDDVRYGYADPEIAPVGYRTLMVWQLADLYYEDTPEGTSIHDALKSGCPPSNIRPDVQQIVPLVESMDLDYIFVYRNVALEHNLQWVKLPDEIDLSSEKHKDLYKQAKVELPGKTPDKTLTKVGNPCIYGVTILKDAPNPEAAAAFVRFMLSEEGRKIVEDNYVEPIAPALTPEPGKLPTALQGLVKQAEL